MFFHSFMQSDVIRKPQGQVELSASSHIVRGDGKQTVQVLACLKVIFLHSLRATLPLNSGDWTWFLLETSAPHPQVLRDCFSHGN